MRFDLLLEHQHFYLAGDVKSEIAQSVLELFQLQGGHATASVADCDVLVFIAQPQTDEALDEVTKTSCFITQKALSKMQKQGWGSIIYVNPTEGMRAMGCAIAMDVCKFNIRVNFVSHLVSRSAPIKTITDSVERFANAALYLASDMSKNVTGQTLWTHHEAFSFADQIQVRDLVNQAKDTDRLLYIEPHNKLTMALAEAMDNRLSLTDTVDTCNCLVFAVDAAKLRHIKDLQEDEFDEIWFKNYVRAHHLCHRAAKRMQAGQGGNIVLIATDNIVGGARLTAALSASVGALKGLMLQINQCYDRVRCNIIMAGALINVLSQEYSDLYTERYGADADYIQNGMQLMSSGKNDHAVIDAVEFLLTPQASSFTGQCIPVNGGIRTLAHANMAYYFQER